MVIDVNRRNWSYSRTRYLLFTVHIALSMTYVECRIFCIRVYFNLIYHVLRCWISRFRISKWIPNYCTLFSLGEKKSGETRTRWDSSFKARERERESVSERLSDFFDYSRSNISIQNFIDTKSIEIRIRRKKILAILRFYWYVCEEH